MQVTVMVLLYILLARGPRIAVNLLAARRATKSAAEQNLDEKQMQSRLQTEPADLDLVSED